MSLRPSSLATSVGPMLPGRSCMRVRLSCHRQLASGLVPQVLLTTESDGNATKSQSIPAGKACENTRVNLWHAIGHLSHCHL